MKTSIRFSGAGGQGVILASILLAKAYGLGEGLNISQTQSYGPEARGGACKAELVVSDQPIDYMKVDEADVFVAMNQPGYDKYISEVKEDGIVLINSTLVDPANTGYCGIPATEIAEKLESPITVNIVMLGALTGLLTDLSPECVRAEINKNFRYYNIDVQEINERAFELGYNHVICQVDQSMQKKADQFNVLVCVTKQKTCDRLITRGREITDTHGGQLSVIHVSEDRFSDPKRIRDMEALDYLYDKAASYGTNLTLIRSDDPIDVLVNFINSNKIDHLILGKSQDPEKENIFSDEIKKRISEEVKIEVVSSTSN